MQATPPSAPSLQAESLLKSKTVRDLIADKKRLVEVPYTATLAHTINALVANNVVAVPVAAPPGQWIGAGGSMILESDKTTGAVRKHYIGMVTMLDVLLHIADATDDKGATAVDQDALMAVPVSSIIGHSLEGLSLWTLTPNTSILDCMEVFSKGIHRALVPVEGQTEDVAGVELAESSPGYRMLTQMDVANFLRANEAELKDILSRPVGELGAASDAVIAVDSRTRVVDAIKGMRAACISAVPIVEASEHPNAEHKDIINGRGRRVVGTFSATDLRGCPITQLQQALFADVLQFTDSVALGPKAVSVGAAGVGIASTRVLVTCTRGTSLAEVITNAVGWHVHRVWVVDEQGLLAGLVSLTDILRVLGRVVGGDQS